PATGGSMAWTVSGANSSLNKYDYGIDSSRMNFDKMGNYNIKAEFTYNGCKSAKVIPIRMIGPVASFSSNFKQNCGVPSTFKVKNDSKNLPGANNFFTWIVSDSAGKFNTGGADTITSMDTLVITLTKFGSYTLILKDSTSTNDKCVDTYTSANFFTIKPPVASMKIRDTSGAVSSAKQFCTCERVVWKNNSGLYTTDTIRVWFTLYNKLDSNSKLDTTAILKEDTINAVIAQFTFDTINYRYCDTGRYIGRMITWSDGGCIDTVFDTVTIAPPKADFNFDTKNICVNGSVTLTQNTTPNISTLQHIFYYRHSDSTVWQTAGIGKSVTVTLTEPGKYCFAYIAKSPGNGSCRDSISKMDSVFVNDLVADFKSATSYGCKGSTIKFDSMGVKSVHPGFATTSLHYQWAVSPTATIAKDTLASTNITFPTNGTYDITLTVTDNKTGCSQTITKNAMISIGVNAGFSIPGSACYKTKITVTNTAQNFPDNYTWSATPSSGSKKVVFDSTSSGFSASAPGITFPDSGCYIVTMKAWKGSCWDTISQQICIERVVPKFSVATISDTLSQCAPRFIKFVSSSKNASYHYWSFGDGNGKYAYTDSTDNLYRTNDSCFDVSLVAISGNGCQDTLTKNCYIHFLGPVPKYTVNKKIGCEPLVVSFTDQSYNIVSKVFDYGDGNTTNGTITNHTSLFVSSSSNTL
ncbi:MAG: hypothetical protein HYZ42_14760, partial [Bacteroidetes bacterium]|nr:hypothetical protein [Bacteroidota bacterium]